MIPEGYPHAMHAGAWLLILSLAAPQDGLIKKDAVVGKGRPAQAGDLIVVDYKGTLADGTTFDQSYGKPPFSFNLRKGQVIKGWDVGMSGMRVGGRRILTIPPELGYGDREMGPIPPNSTLKFEVICHDIWPEKGPRIRIEMVRPGTGRAAKKGDTIMVHYKGSFPNGLKFDSSYDSGKPMAVTLGTGGVIPGFEQGLLGMKAGGKRKISIHPDLAYGDSGQPPAIPRKAVLNFELELVSFK